MTWFSKGIYLCDLDTESGALSDLTKGDIDTDASGVVSLAELNAIATVESGFVFPNASRQGEGGLLNPGDATAVGGGVTFDPGTVLGMGSLVGCWACFLWGRGRSGW